jgi:hypothetical protein
MSAMRCYELCGKSSRFRMKERKVFQPWKDYLEETIQAFNEAAKIVQQASNW